MKKLTLVLLLLQFCISCTAAPHVIITKISNAEFSNLVQLKNPITKKTKPVEHEEEKTIEEPVDSGFTSVQLDVEILEPGNKKYYDAILPNNSFSFLAYQNQCEIFFDASGINSFTLYINNVEIETANICKNGFVKVDVTEIIKNGRNILYVSNIEKKYNTASLKLRIPYPVLTRSNKKIRSINYTALELVDEILQSQVAHGFSSVQLLVAKDGFVIADKSYGTIYNANNFPQTSFGTAPTITGKTLYDLASNTKMYATVFAIQRLVFLKKISIHDKVSSFFPEFTDTKNAKYTGKAEMTIEHLLTHSSGFPAGAAYYAKKAVKQKYGTARKQAVLQEILKTKLIHDVGTEVVYSDINFMLLSFIVEKITGQSFAAFVENEIYTPLHLKRICFKPLAHGFPLSEIAATEIGLDRSAENEPYNGFAHGRVHDPEAFGAMNEVSGHAGLFGNAESLAVLAQTMINGGGYGNTRLFSENTSRSFLSLSQYHPGYALGWRTQNTEEYKWAFSTLASPYTFGHTGWTGTLSLFDVENNLIIIILTNAKHSKYAGANKFEGDYFLAKNYGAITSIIYSAFSEYDMEYFSSLLAELAVQKYELIVHNKKFQNNGAYSDLASIMDVVKKHRTSPRIKKFLKTDIAKHIDSFLKENQK